MTWWLAENVVVAAVLAALIAPVCHLGRLRPAVRHALWLIVMLRLVWPPIVFWPWQTPSVRPWCEVALRPEVHDWIGTGGVVSEPRYPPTGSEGSAVVKREVFIARSSSDSHPSVASRLLPSSLGRHDPIPAPLRWLVSHPGAAIRWLWLVGSVAACLLQVVRIARMHRLVRRMRPAPQPLVALIGQLARRLSVRAPVVAVHDQLAAPWVWGLGTPRLLWPAQLAGAAQQPAWQGVAVHELAHLRRRDHWVGWLELIAGCIWWWNPLFWYVRHQVRENAELACDAWVIALLPQQRRGYAEILLTVCQFQSGPHQPAPAVGIGHSGRRVLERRLRMILRESIPCRMSWFTLAGVAALGLVVLPSWSQDGASENASAARDEIYTGQVFPVTASADEVRPITSGPETASAAAQQPPANGQSLPTGLPRVVVTSEDQVGSLAEEKEQIADEHRIADLEAQIRQLMDMVQSLQKSKTMEENIPKPRTTSSQTSTVTGHKSLNATITLTGEKPVPYGSSGPALTLSRLGASSDAAGSHGDKTVLERVTYRLSKGKAEELAGFLQRNIHPDFVTVKVSVEPATPNQEAKPDEAGRITITTIPEAQRSIGQFIEFLHQAPQPELLGITQEQLRILTPP